MADGMMANPYLGLMNAGLSPEQAQAEVDRQRAIQFANLNPQQRIASGIYGGLTQAARALGARDPMLEQASQLRQLAGQFDTNTAEGMMQFANAARSISPQLAQQAAAQAQQMMQQQATLAKTQAETISKLREQDPKTLFVKANADKFTPDSLQTYATTGNYSSLVPVTKEDKTTKPPADFIAKAVELGYGEKTRLGEYTQEQVKAVNTALFDQQVSLAKEKRPPPVSVSVETKAEGAFATELGKIDAKRVEEARKSRETAMSELKTLEQATSLAGKPLVTGTAAGARVDLLNLLDTVGILGGRRKEELINSQQFDKITGDLVLDKIKKLGANPSNADREFIARIVPNLTTSPEARTQLLQYLQKRANDVVKEADALEQYAAKNRGLTGYRPQTVRDWNSL